MPLWLYRNIFYFQANFAVIEFVLYLQNFSQMYSTSSYEPVFTVVGINLLQLKHTPLPKTKQLTEKGIFIFNQN